MPISLKIETCERTVYGRTTARPDQGSGGEVASSRQNDDLENGLFGPQISSKFRPFEALPQISKKSRGVWEGVTVTPLRGGPTRSVPSNPSGPEPSRAVPSRPERSRAAPSCPQQPRVTDRLAGGELSPGFAFRPAAPSPLKPRILSIHSWGTLPSDSPSFCG